MTLGLSSMNWWSASATPEDDRLAVAALDLEYQAAVKRNDAAVMDRILHPDYALILGDGSFVSRKGCSTRLGYGSTSSKSKMRMRGRRLSASGGTRRSSLPGCGSRALTRKVVRPDFMVQRHLRPDADRLALCICPGVATASAGKAQAGLVSCGLEGTFGFGCPGDFEWQAICGLLALLLG